MLGLDGAQHQTVSLLDLHPPRQSFLGQVLAGLASEPKQLPCMYFYDRRGSELFDRICELDEYYLTRTELAILEQAGPQIAACLGADSSLIELGSGSSLKTRLLLRALGRLHSYVPVDISREHLLSSSLAIARAFPKLAVQAVCADFLGELRLPPFERAPRRKFVWFPGSTLGNLDRRQRAQLFERVRRLCLPEGGGLLLGIDLKKDARRLERAYNDAAGVTAAFNLNLLSRINRELRANFRLEAFEHRAIYDESHGRIEMHLHSLEPQSVRLAERDFAFRKGESICTEHSYKFSIADVAALAGNAGFTLTRQWTDPEQLFAVLLLSIASG